MSTASHFLVGAVLFPGFELLDIFGPLEMFGLLGDQVSIRMLAQKAGEIPSRQGPKAVADICLSETGALDVLLIPGGLGTRVEVENQALLATLKTCAESAQYVGTICTGSALLARTGLLDGKMATSNKRAFAWVRTQGPNVDWIPKARWVEDSKIFYLLRGVGRNRHDARPDPPPLWSGKKPGDCPPGGISLERR